MFVVKYDGEEYEFKNTLIGEGLEYFCSGRTFANTGAYRIRASLSSIGFSDVYSTFAGDMPEVSGGGIIRFGPDAAGNNIYRETGAAILTNIGTTVVSVPYIYLYASDHTDKYTNDAVNYLIASTAVTTPITLSPGASFQVYYRLNQTLP